MIECVLCDTGTLTLSSEQEEQVATALEGTGENGLARINENQTKWPLSGFNIAKEIFWILLGK